MKKVAIIGTRGMVGQVLRERMQNCGDFELIEPIFFSTSQKGQKTPLGGDIYQDAYDLKALKKYDIILTTQGSEYTREIYPRLRSEGFNGYWIDAASELRMDKDSAIVLDPVNYSLIQEAIARGCKTFVGSNCTVGLLLMAIAPLVKEDLVEWVSSMSYQAISGAGASELEKLLSQIDSSANKGQGKSILHREEELRKILEKDNALLGSLHPWIDSQMPSGQSREEWKSQVEANKILGLHDSLKIDGTCVRVATFRSHAQGVTLKLKKTVELSSIEEMIKNAHEWIKWVPNTKEETLKDLTPLAVSGTLDIAVGRVRKMTLGEDYLNLFTIGDQLLWGAAEPLRRALRLLLK